MFLRAKNYPFSLGLKRSWLHISVTHYWTVSSDQVIVPPGIGLLSHASWSTEIHQTFNQSFTFLPISAF